jgi:hypothetical protein
MRASLVRQALAWTMTGIYVRPVTFFALDIALVSCRVRLQRFFWQKITGPEIFAALPVGIILNVFGGPTLGASFCSHGRRSVQVQVILSVRHNKFFGLPLCRLKSKHNLGLLPKPEHVSLIVHCEFLHGPRGRQIPF